MKTRDEKERRRIIDAIQQSVADKFGLTVEQLVGTSTRKDVVIPRQIAIYLAKQRTDASLVEIGSYFGGKHHTTVFHSIAKVEEQRREETVLAQVIEGLLKAIPKGTVSGS